MVHLVRLTKEMLRGFRQTLICGVLLRCITRIKQKLKIIKDVNYWCIFKTETGRRANRCSAEVQYNWSGECFHVEIHLNINFIVGWWLWFCTVLGPNDPSLQASKLDPSVDCKTNMMISSLANKQTNYMIDFGPMTLIYVTCSPSLYKYILFFMIFFSC